MSDHGPIDEPKTVDDVRKEPLKLPKGFVWDVIDVNNQAQVRACTFRRLHERYSWPAGRACKPYTGGGAVLVANGELRGGR